MTAAHIPALKVEQQDGLVLVSQRRDGQVHAVSLHPTHIRYLAEQCGLAPTSDPTVAKQIATLARRLRVLQERIDTLGDFLTHHSDHRHADLSHELTLATALADLADEFVADLDLPEAPGQCETSQ